MKVLSFLFSLAAGGAERVMAGISSAMATKTKSTHPVIFRRGFRAQKAFAPVLISSRCRFLLLLFVTLLAFRCSERGLPVMARSTEPVLVNVIHFHARSAFFVFEDRRMAVATFEHSCVNSVAKNRRRHVSGRITQVFF